MRRVIPTLVFLLAVPFLIACPGTMTRAVKSDGVVERTLRYLGGPQALDVVLPLLSPRSTPDFASVAVGFSALRGEPVLLQLPREDTAQAALVRRGQAIVVTEGELGQTPEGARTVTATAWRLRPATAEEVGALLSAYQCALLGVGAGAELTEEALGGRPECPGWGGSVEEVKPEHPGPTGTRGPGGAAFAAPRGEPGPEMALADPATASVPAHQVDRVADALAHAAACREQLWQVRMALALFEDRVGRGLAETDAPLDEAAVDIDRFLRGQAP